MENALRIVNKMVSDGVIDSYAIGGAVGAIFYIEPINTSDVDIFFEVASAGDDLMLLAPLYEYLAGLGYEAEGDAVRIEDWLVQFLPVFNPLIDEAVREAREVVHRGVRTRIMQAEHLMAIMLQTGRGKDYARLIEFAGQDVFDESRLNKILRQHDLHNRWLEFKQKFLG